MDFKQVVNDVKQHVLIEDTVQDSGVILKPSGYRLKGLCPFHMEKTPSFMVDPQTQTYRCYGCGVFGDVISFVMEQQQLSFMESLTMLAEENGVELPKDFSDSSEEEKVDYRTLREVVRHTANHFYKNFKNLDESHPARQEIRRRGLSENSKILYGYASEQNKDLYTYLKSKNFSDEAIQITGVCREGDYGFYDFWRGRLMFFIADATGRPVGFSGRILDESDKGGKYVNSVDSPVFNKSKVLFNLSNARKEIAETQTAYIVEGQFDVSALVDAGIDNVVASSGTAFTKDHANTLSRMTDNGTLVFCFDGDKAGIKAAFHVFNDIPEIHTQAMVVSMPDGLDPCDYRQEYGDEQLKSFLESNRRTMLDFMLDSLEKDCDLDSEIGRNDFYRRSVTILSKVDDPILLKTGARKVALKSIAEISGVMNQVREAKKGNRKNTTHNQNSEHKQSERPELSGGELDEYLCKLLEQDRIALISSKMVALAMKTRCGLVDELWSNDDLSDNILSAIEPLRDHHEHVYPEMFSTPRYVGSILEDSFMPVMPDSTDDDIHLHNDFLKNALSKEVLRQKNDAKRAKIYRTLSGGSSEDLALALGMTDNQAKD